MDVFDQAQQNDELFRQAALRNHFAGRQDRQTGTEFRDGDRFEICPRNETSGRHPEGAGPDVSRICLDCGDEIELARLTAVPNAVRCLDCQGKKERRDRGLG